METHKLNRWNYLINRLFTGGEKKEAREVKSGLRKIRANEFKDQIIDALKVADVNNVHDVGQIISMQSNSLPKDIRGWFIKGLNKT